MDNSFYSIGEYFNFMKLVTSQIVII